MPVRKVDVAESKDASHPERSRREQKKEILLQIPKMVFSIIGDSDNFVPKPWRKSVFQTALIDAAQNAGDSWIILRDDRVGVSKIVIDAYKDYFCSEYFDVKGKSLSIHSEKTDLPIHLINLRKEGNAICPKLLAFEANSSEERKHLFPEFKLEKLPVSCPLKEMELTGEKADFECQMSLQEGSFFNLKKSEELRMRVPVILIVVEGDLETIEYAKSAVQKNIPVLLIKGSGKAADLIVKCIQDEEKKEIEAAVKKMSPLLFGTSFDYSKLKTLSNTINDLAAESHLINIFDVDNDDPLMLSKIVGEAIVRTWALENAYKGPPSEKGTPYFTQSDVTKVPLEMTQDILYANSLEKTNIEIDIPGPAVYIPNTNTRNPVVYIGVRDSLSKKTGKYVKKYTKRPHVLNTKFLSPASLPLYFYFGYQLLQENKMLESDQGSILLLEALKSNRRDYVQVLLDQGVNFNAKHLAHLYVNTVKCETCKDDDECLHISWVLRQSHPTAGKLAKNKKDDADLVKKKAHHLVRSLLGYKELKESTKYDKIQEAVEKETGRTGSETTIKTTDLLLWSIFANRPDLSEVLWLASDDHLLSALMCAVLLKKISKKANNVKEEVLARSLKEHAKLFSDRCLQMMSEMYEQNAKAAMKVVDSEVRIWGILTTPMTFAYENFEMDFIAHTCPQRRLNRIWYNKLAPDFKPFLKASVKTPKKFAKAPFTRFLINYFLFLLMLIAFSALVMTSIDDYYYRRTIARVWEYYIYVWAGGDLLEEIKNGMGIFTTGGKSHRGYLPRTKRYLYDFWNAVDLLSYILLLLALFTRHLIEPDPFTIARRLFSISLLLMYLRYLQVFLMNRRLGPTLIMIKEMLKDLSYFLAIAFVAIIGVGIYYHANLYPNHISLVGPGEWNTWHVWKILYYPYWQLYGESFSEFLEVQEQSNCTSDRSLYEVSTDLERCAEKDPTVPIVSAAYMLISNLLLVNLVIAMFSYTFDTVMANSEKLWRFQRYTVITDYEGKVPSPFNFIIRPLQLCNYAWRKCKIAIGKSKNEHEKSCSKRIYKLSFQKMIASRCSSSHDTTP